MPTRLWDVFDDVNGTLITAHTPNYNVLPGTAYQILRTATNHAEIQGNVLQKPEEGSWTGGFYTWDATGLADQFVLGMIMTPVWDGTSGGTTQTANTSGAGWVIHGVDSNNHYMARIRWNGTTNHFGMYKRVTGGVTIVGDWDIGGDAVTPYRYELLVDTVIDGDGLFTLYRDGVQVAQNVFGSQYPGYFANENHGPYLLTGPGDTPYNYEAFWIAEELGYVPGEDPDPPDPGGPGGGGPMPNCVAPIIIVPCIDRAGRTYTYPPPVMGQADWLWFDSDPHNWYDGTPACWFEPGTPPPANAWITSQMDQMILEESPHIYVFEG